MIELRAQFLVKVTLLSILLELTLGKAYTDYDVKDREDDLCPLYPQKLTGYVPKGNMSAGVYTLTKYDRLKPCVLACCRSTLCNVVLLHDEKCYHLKCNDDEQCAPALYANDTLRMHMAMVLVRPVTDGESWSNFIEDIEGSKFGVQEMLKKRILSQLLGHENYDNNFRYAGDEPDLTDNVQPIGDSGKFPTDPKDCDADDQCDDLEECVQNEGTRGLCQCVTGYSRQLSGVCKRDDRPKYKTQLTVSVMSKEIRLPENEVDLSAYTVPNEPDVGQPYSYVWTLVSGPKNSETTRIQNGSKMRLSKLSEGLYVFNVSVSGMDSYGETLANVTVLPPNRINKPPVVVINPSSQIVRLPNTGAVLDASGSYDDDKIVSWQWELQGSPVGYEPQLPDTSLLQLNDLTHPGNYTFKLTVADSDGASNFTTANITVMKVIDYPPIANAGEDVIVYLPNNKLILNGNLSKDDHEIKLWEWTKSPGDTNKAVDMQDTRTPYLKLSNLVEGVYTFVLNVTDEAGQTTTDDVRVFVKPSSHHPPAANAGPDLFINLPQTYAVLNGSASSSESGKIERYFWEQLSGPANGVISSNESVTNVTNLTKGQYVFKLTVLDDSGNKAVDNVTVNVTQVKNERPKANAGGDQIIELPQSIVILNGSGSYDDLAITNWQWTREELSLAVGKVLGDSDRKQMLLLTALEPGRYVFKLKVFDEEGLFDEDTASLMVKPDPLLPYVVDMTLGVQARSLTQAQVHEIMQELGLLVRDEVSLTLREIRTEKPGGRAVLSLYGITEKNKQSALQLEQLLKSKLRRDSSLLRLSVVSIQTAVCQNNCSNHGVCDEHTRHCLCEAFWMQNLFDKYFGDGDSDCEWSVVYVIIAICTAGLMVTAFVWTITSLCTRKSSCSTPSLGRRTRTRKPNLGNNIAKTPPRYSLLADTESHGASHAGKLSDTDDESDSEVLFETRKPDGMAQMRNGILKNGTSTNYHENLIGGYMKMGRKIKT